ncbi:hypothetical protein ES703_104467 [subsurface metagenome]
MKNSKKNMFRLTEDEKQELILLSRSTVLKNEMRQIKKNTRRLSAGKGTVNSLDEYIEFLSAANAFAGHKKKAFKKIQGKIFKI